MAVLPIFAFYFIVLDQYTRDNKVNESFQSEHDPENELVDYLMNQGHEFLPDLKSSDAMLANIREQLQMLNHIDFSDAQWKHFVASYLKSPVMASLIKPEKITINTLGEASTTTADRGTTLRFDSMFRHLA